jgi:hypothetical protein
MEQVCTAPNVKTMLPPTRSDLATLPIASWCVAVTTGGQFPLDSIRPRSLLLGDDRTFRFLFATAKRNTVVLESALLLPILIRSLRLRSAAVNQQAELERRAWQEGSDRFQGDARRLAVTNPLSVLPTCSSACTATGHRAHSSSWRKRLLARRSPESPVSTRTSAICRVRAGPFWLQYTTGAPRCQPVPVPCASHARETRDMARQRPRSITVWWPWRRRRWENLSIACTRGARGPSRGTCGLCNCRGPPRARGPKIKPITLGIYRSMVTILLRSIRWISKSYHAERPKLH